MTYYGDLDTSAVLNMELLDLNVEYEVTEGEPEVAYLSNGDPGHPGTGDEVTLLFAYDEQGEDRLHELSAEDCSRIENEILNRKEHGQR